jgi:Uma2 family endonuclease
MQEYILLDQKQHHIIQHTKTETGQWLLTEYRGEESSLSLKAIQFDLGLSDIYEGVDFDDSEE